jgi:hypothetical protein
MNISLGFLTYNSYDYIKRQLDHNYFDASKGLIDEIIIQDDFTDDYNKLKSFETKDIKVFQNPEHLFPLLGRFNLVENCKNDWVLVMDSDNFLHEQSFDVIRNLSLSSDTIYCPDFGTPGLDYRELSNTDIDIQTAKNILTTKSVSFIEIFLNTGNYLVPKQRYLEMLTQVDKQLAEYTIDVIYFNYLWLKSGNKLSCVKNFQYEHTYRDNSYYRTHGMYSHEKYAGLIRKFIS